MAVERKDNSMDKDFVYPMGKPMIPIEGREREIQFLIETLYKKRMRNLILIGEAGVGKTELVKEVAQRMKDQYTFFVFDMAMLEAGTNERGSFETKVKSVVFGSKAYENNQRKKVVLFIDEIHTMVTVGGCRGLQTEQTCANILKPYISSGEITVWGATTLSEYKDTIGRDKALERRMPRVYLSELPQDRCVSIVNHFLEGTKIEGKGEMMVRLSKDLPGSYPDKCIELADRAQARLHSLKRRKLTEDILENIVKDISEEMRNGVNALSLTTPIDSYEEPEEEPMTLEQMKPFCIKDEPWRESPPMVCNLMDLELAEFAETGFNNYLTLDLIIRHEKKDDCPVTLVKLRLYDMNTGKQVHFYYKNFNEKLYFGFIDDQKHQENSENQSDIEYKKTVECFFENDTSVPEGYCLSDLHHYRDVLSGGRNYEQRYLFYFLCYLGEIKEKDILEYTCEAKTQLFGCVPFKKVEKIEKACHEDEEDDRDNPEAM